MKKVSQGIITSTDSICFSAFQLFSHSLRKTNPNVPLLVFDIGLESKEINWCKKNKINLIKYENPIIPKSLFMWQTWNKPDYIFRSPFEYTLWLDSDTIVYKKLNKLFEVLKKNIVSIKDFFGAEINNKRELYEIYPVEERLKNPPNGGVLGICKTRKKDIDFLKKYLFMTKEAAKSQHLRDLIKWWDQGVIHWALEASKNSNVILCEREFNDALYNPNLRLESPNLLYEELKKRKSTIVHLGGCPKPYFWFKKDISNKTIKNSLKVFVLGHNEESLKKVENEPFIQKLDLSKLELAIPNTEDIAENKFYLTDYVFRCKESYVGVMTHRYKQKYNLDIKKLPQIVDKLDERCVFTCHFARKEWFDYSINYHPGIEKYIREISEVFNLPIRRKHVFWANNFICHKFVFADFIYKFRDIFHYINSKYGYNFDYKVDFGQDKRKAAFLYERVAMLYFSNQDHLKVIQIPYAKSGYDCYDDKKQLVFVC
jgi:hypothetical protein